MHLLFADKDTEVALSGGQDGLSHHRSSLSLSGVSPSSRPSVAPYTYHTLQPSNKSSERGMFSRTANASPLSVRSAFVSRYDYGRANYVSHMTRNMNTMSTLSLNSKNMNKNCHSNITTTTNISDNESSVSKSSRHSRRSSRSHRSSSRNGRHHRQHSQQSEDSGTECSTVATGSSQRQQHSSRRHRRSRRKHSNNNNNKTPELVNWDNIVERKQQTISGVKQDDEMYSGKTNKQANAIVKNVASYVGGQHCNNTNDVKTESTGQTQLRYFGQQLTSNDVSYRKDNTLPVATNLQQSLSPDAHVRGSRDHHHQTVGEAHLINWDSAAYYNHKSDR